MLFPIPLITAVGAIINPFILYFSLNGLTYKHSPAPLKVRKLAGSNPALTLEMLRGCTDNLS
jgi:hypothetical protein